MIYLTDANSSSESEAQTATGRAFPICQLSGVTLAYVGDAVYELWVRAFLIEKGLVRAEALHNAAVSFVRAKGQATLIKALLPDLDGEERAVFYRGRNARSQCPRRAEVLDYRHATGFEALIGFLYLSGRRERLNELLAKIEGLIRDGEVPGASGTERSNKELLRTERADGAPEAK